MLDGAPGAARSPENTIDSSRRARGGFWRKVRFSVRVPVGTPCTLHGEFVFSIVGVGVGVIRTWISNTPRGRYPNTVLYLLLELLDT